MSAIRLQVAVYDVLQAEVVLPDYATANRIWARYACARYDAGKPMGGAIIQRADLPRYWDVPVGDTIPYAVFSFDQDDFKGGTFALYTIVGGPRHRSTVTAETLAELGIPVRS